MDRNRRHTLGLLGAALGAGAAAPLLGPVGAAAPSPRSGAPAPLPWPYAELDPQAVAERAYWAYFDGHCMYSVFTGVVEELGEKLGAPYTTFPLELMRYGAGGVAGWGTLCGALNGGAAVFQLTCEDPAPLIDELFWWYSNEPLPDYLPAENPKPLPTSVARSTLCHASVARWCEVSGFGAYSRERNERCARLASATARVTAELLNRYHAGTFSPQFPTPEHVRKCRSCHERGGEVENIRSRMDCSLCHDDLPQDHGEGRRADK